MLRKLLACLALLTGLTAAGAPAQAEVAIAIASQLDANVASEASAALASAPQNALAGEVDAPDGAVPKRAIKRIVPQPAVRLGSDRAHE